MPWSRVCSKVLAATATSEGTDLCWLGLLLFCEASACRVLLCLLPTLRQGEQASLVCLFAHHGRVDAQTHHMVSLHVVVVVPGFGLGWLGSLGASVHAPHVLGVLLCLSASARSNCVFPRSVTLIPKNAGVA